MYGHELVVRSACLMVGEGPWDHSPFFVPSSSLEPFVSAPQSWVWAWNLRLEHAFSLPQSSKTAVHQVMENVGRFLPFFR